MTTKMNFNNNEAVAGKGVCIFIYLCFARQISFQIDQFEFNLKKKLAGRTIENLRSTTRPVRQRGSNFSSKMSAEHFDAVKVINLLRFFN